SPRSSGATSSPSRYRARPRRRYRPGRARAGAGGRDGGTRSELQRLTPLQDAREQEREAEDDHEPDDGDGRRVAEVEGLPLEGALDHVGRHRLGAPHGSAPRHHPYQGELLHLADEIEDDE